MAVDSDNEIAQSVNTGQDTAVHEHIEPNEKMDDTFQFGRFSLYR